MKITIVSEDRIIIAVLQKVMGKGPVQSESTCCTSQQCGSHDPHQDSDTPLGTLPEPGPGQVIHSCCNECGPDGHIAQATQQAPSLAVPLETFPPCAEGDVIHLTVKVDSIMERNG